MLYATLKLVHVLSLIVWIGGMVFAHFFLRPAVQALEPPQRLRLNQHRSLDSAGNKAHRFANISIITDDSVEKIIQVEALARLFQRLGGAGKSDPLSDQAGHVVQVLQKLVA